MKHYLARFVIVVMLAGALLSACVAPTPQVVTVKETVVVSTEKIVQQTVVVEQTKVVEKVVEKEKIVVATVVPPTAVPQVPKEKQIGGTVNVWLPNGWPDQSQLFLSHWESVWAVSPMTDPYINILKDGSIEYRLAEKIDVSADGLTYTMKLRSGAKFHNGDPVTADDFIYSMLIHYHPKLVPIWGMRNAADIKGIADYQSGKADAIAGLKKVDDQTVQFTLSGPNAGFLKLFFGGSGTDIPYIQDKKVLEKLDQAKLLANTEPYWYTKPIGTGPYKFVQYVTDQYIEYARNDAYWGGKVGPDKLFMKIASPEVALVSLQKGEMDLVTPLALTEVARLKADPKVQIVEAENTGSWWGLEANTFAQGGLWANPKAKQALMYSIDRQAYVNAILQGYGKVRDSFFDGTMYACPTMTHYTYDPAKAEALWNEIGLTKDKRAKIEITYMSWLGNKARLDYLPIAQEYLRKLGFLSNVDLIDNSLQPAYNWGLGPRGKEFSFNVLWYGPGADPGSIDPWLRPGQASNAYYRSWPEKEGADGKKATAPYYNNARVNELLDKAKVESNADKRKAYFQEIDCIWNQELPSLTTAAASNLAAKSPRLQGLDWANMAALGQPSLIWHPGDLWIWAQAPK